MDSLHETRSNAISVAKEQIRQKKLISDTAAHPAELPQAEGAPVPLGNPRTVAGHVSRRANANTRALPPPSSTNTSSTSGREAKSDKGKGRRDNHNGNHSDSESEDDNRKRGRIDHGNAPTLQRKPTGTMANVGPSGHNSSASSFLTLEEQNRIKLRAELRAAEEKLKPSLRNMDAVRSSSKRERILKDKKQRSCLSEEKHEKQQLLERMQIYDQWLRDFYDEVLFHHIEQQLHEGTEREEDMPGRSDAYYIHKVLRKVENRIIIRCKAFDTNNRNYYVVGSEEQMNRDRMIRIFKRMETYFVEDILATGNSENIRHRTPVIISSIWEGEETTFTGKLEKSLVDQYLCKLSERLVEVVTRTISSEHGSSRQLEHDWGEFIDSVKTTLDNGDVRELSERERKIERFRALSHPAIRQEVIENMDRSKGVSLALLKGTMLASIRDVSMNMLEELGWKRDDSTSSYWRYSEGHEVRREIFKVQMDGEVVGIWTVDGDISWDPTWEAGTATSPSTSATSSKSARLAFRSRDRD